MRPINTVAARDFPSVYEALGINTNDLGCIMLDIAPIKVSDIIDPNDLYYANDPVNHKYIDGVVSEGKPHVTLLYGLLESGQTYKPYVDTVLKGWSIDNISIDSVGFFESNYDDESYYCLVAHIISTPELIEGNGRLQLLPHCNTFLSYDPHVTLAYVKQDSKKINFYINELNAKLTLKSIKVEGINYGD